jgi:hypothetical protein
MKKYVFPKNESERGRNSPPFRVEKDSIMNWKTTLRILSITLVFAFTPGCGDDGGGTNASSGGGAGPMATISGSASWSTDTGFLNTLDGSSSSDPEGDTLTYSWSIQSKPSGSTTRIDGADQALAEFEPDVAGTYVIQLMVSDGATSSQPDTVTITASGPTTGWKRMGGVLDLNYEQDAQNPSVATDASGNPVVVWEETDPITANMENIHAKKWNGSAWVQLGSALDTDITNDTSDPRVAIDPTDGNPVVTWRERSPVGLIYVKKWNGSVWNSLGGALNDDTTRNAYLSSLAVGSDGNPVVAWSENVPDPLSSGNVSDIFVKRWNGMSWVQLGDQRDYDDIDKHPAVAIDPGDGKPVLAWSEGSTVLTTYFGDIVVEKWNGAAWTLLDMTFETDFSPEGTALVVGSDSLPIAAWHETALSQENVTVMKYDGSNFTGGITAPNPTGNDFSASLLVDSSDNLPILAFATTDSIYVKKWNGNAWTQYGEEANYRTFPGEPSIAFGSLAKIVITWNEEPHVTYSDNVYVKIQE